MLVRIGVEHFYMIVAVFLNCLVVVKTVGFRKAFEHG